MIYTPETETHAPVQAPILPIYFFPKFSASSHDDFVAVVNNSSCSVRFGHGTA